MEYGVCKQYGNLNSGFAVNASVSTNIWRPVNSQCFVHLFIDILNSDTFRLLRSCPPRQRYCKWMFNAFCDVYIPLSFSPTIRSVSRPSLDRCRRLVARLTLISEILQSTVLAMRSAMSSPEEPRHLQIPMSVHNLVLSKLNPSPIRLWPYQK